MAGYARAHVMKNSVFTLEGVDFVGQVNKVNFVPDTPIQQMRTLSPTGTITDIDTTVWTMELAGVQDFGSGSLGAALRTAAGTLQSVVFQPKTGAAQDKIEAEVMCMHIPFGGEQGAWRTFDISLPVDGVPTFSQST
jgi:hypothetical protein